MKTLKLIDGEEYVINGAKTPEDLKVFKVHDNHIKIAENLEDVNNLVNKKEIVKDHLLSLLTSKAVPYPFTVYKNIYMLSKYDKALIRQKNYEWVVEDIIDSPYLSDKSRNDKEYTEELFEKTLNNAVSKSVEGHDDIILLLSDGKDSVPIAIALSNLGIKARCFSFAERGSETHLFTENLAKKLEHNYHLIDANELRSVGLDKILSVYNKLLFPTGDFSSLIYVILKIKYCSSNTIILDGSGNDLYFGYTLKQREKISYYSRKLNIDPVAGLTGYGFLQFCNYLFGIDTRDDMYPSWYVKYWNEYLKKINHLNLNDIKLLTRGRHLINGDCMNKARYFHQNNLLKISFPWMEDNLVKYIFNLPEEQKRNHRKNKICLREYIEKKLSESASYVFKKRTFSVRYPDFKKTSYYKYIDSNLSTNNDNIKFRYMQLSSTLGASFES